MQLASSPPLPVDGYDRWQVIVADEDQENRAGSANVKTYEPLSQGIAVTMANSSKWPFLVHYTDAIGPVWVWIEAESAHQITSAYDGVTIPDPYPEWATPELMSEFGAYSLDDPNALPAWLRQHRRNQIG